MILTFTDALKKVLKLTESRETVKIREIRSCLARRGTAALLIIFSIPIPIPGLSNLFGIILAIIAFQYALGKEIWWPRWVLERSITSTHLKKFMEKTISYAESIQKIVHPRLTFLVQRVPFTFINSLLICILAFITALPIPIPFTNILFSTPILVMSFGLLEDDGIFILFGYGLILIDVAIFFGIFHFWNHFATLMPL